MKKILNKPEDALTECLAGFVTAHKEIVKMGETGRFVQRAVPANNRKVALISGGGSGHEPLHAGFIGEGMLDAACPGEVFTSPTPDQMMAAAEAMDVGGGVLFIVKNYAGDVMNFEMAAEMVDCETASVITDDDVALADMDAEHEQGRRGVAGTIIVEKIVGAAAEGGASLSACESLGNTVNNACGSMAIALSSCTVPEAGKPTFSLGEDEMELGVGIHGEAGRARVPLATADEIADQLLTKVLEKIDPRPDDPLLLFCNGLGGTPALELYVLYNAAVQLLGKKGLNIARSLVGNYCTSLEMAGASLTVARLDDEKLKLWDQVVKTPALSWGD